MKKAIIACLLCIIASSCQKDIEPAPIAKFTYKELRSDRTGAIVQFFNESTGGDKYTWDFGDGTGGTNLEMPLYTYAENGIYSVKLTVEGAGGKNSFTQNVRINTIPKTGSFIFWSRIRTGGNTTIRIEGQVVGVISVYHVAAGVPACDQLGFVTVTLPEGFYRFTAKDQSIFPKNWAGTFQVINGLCRNTELTL